MTVSQQVNPRCDKCGTDTLAHSDLSGGWEECPLCQWMQNIRHTPGHGPGWLTGMDRSTLSCYRSDVPDYNYDDYRGEESGDEAEWWTKTFRTELEHVINRHSMENASNTPDFILAQYLSRCLEAFDTAVQQRETWYGRDPRPTSSPVEAPVDSEGRPVV